MNCVEPNAKLLWDTFKDAMSEDYTHKGLPLAQAHNLALHDIWAILGMSGKDESTYSILQPQRIDREAWLNRELRAEMSDDPSGDKDKALHMREQMYEGQGESFDKVRQAIDASENLLYFVDGAGGTGKSFLFDAVLHYARGTGHVALACAWSGLAATLLPGGRTVSSRFGLPVPLPADEVQYNVKANSDKGRLLTKARIIVIDEVSMVPLEALTAIDTCLRDICENNFPFGGKVIVFGGDFRQVLPVVPRAEAEEIKSHTVSRHPYFLSSRVVRHTLTHNRRAANDVEYSKFLLDLGDGAIPDEPSVGPHAIQLPDRLLMPATDGIVELVQWVFGDVRTQGLECVSTVESADDIASLSAKALLAPKNDVVDSVNDMILQTFDTSDVHTFFSSDCIKGGSAEDYNNYQADFLNSLDMPGLPPHKLRVCTGSVVMLIRNIDTSNGLCNGIRAIIVQTSIRLLEVRIITGKARGQRVFLPRIPITSHAHALPFQLQRQQFPVKLAWTMTINKAK